MKALIFAAGIGSRLKTLTNEKPKALVEVNGIPMIQLLIEKLKGEGINSFIINIHHFGDQIIDFFKNNNNFDCEIQFSDERDKLLDTGGGLKKAQKYLKDEKYFLVHNVDILSDISIKKIEEHHNACDTIATLAVQERKSSRKLIFDETGLLCGWKNIKKNEVIHSRTTQGKKTDYAFSGIHIINSEIFDLLEKGEKYSIIPEYLTITKNHKIQAFEDLNPVFDLGTAERIAEAEKHLKKS